MSAPPCPFCDSRETVRVGQWGGQIITAQWRCESCDSYFEAVRSDFDDEGGSARAGEGENGDRGAGPASIRIRRRIEWIDTDAAGIYHWTTVCRLAEAAEAELHRALGISELTFGVSPRVAVRFEFKRRLRFDDPVEVELRVVQVGRSSVSYEVEIVGPEGTAASGRIDSCLVDGEEGKAISLPAGVRKALTSAGAQANDGQYCDPA